MNTERNPYHQAHYDIEDIEEINHRLWHRFERMQKSAIRYAHLQHGSRVAHGKDASRGQGRVLKTLTLVPEITQRDLQNILDMRQQSLAELLGKLEGKGYIVREADENDRRKQIIRLTEAGREAAEEVKAEEAKHDQSGFSFFDCLSEEEKGQLEDYLIRVTDRLDEEATESMQGFKDEKRRGRKRGRTMGGGAERGPRFRWNPYEDTHSIQDDQPTDQMFCDHNCRSCQIKAQGGCLLRG